MSIPAHDRESLLELLRQILPEHYLGPLEDLAGGLGFDGYAAAVAIMARASEASNTTQRAALYLREHSLETAPPAAGERHATGTVDITRTPRADFDLVVAAGRELVTELRTPAGESVEGPRLRLVADTTIPSGSLGPVTADVEAERPGWQGNLPEGAVAGLAPLGRVSLAGTTIDSGNVLLDDGDGERITSDLVGQYVRFVAGANAGTAPRRILSVTQGPSETEAILDGAALSAGTADVEIVELADLGVTLEQSAPLEGGRHGWLDYKGSRERRIGRKTGEADDSYRLRVLEVADVVSPGAIIRAAERAFTPDGLTFLFLEPRRDMKGFVLDSSPLDFGTIRNGDVFTPGARFFVIVVEGASLGDFGFAYDNHPEGALDFGFFDGEPLDYQALLGEAYEDIDAARAHGMRWELVRDDTL